MCVCVCVCVVCVRVCVLPAYVPMADGGLRFLVNTLTETEESIVAPVAMTVS